MASNPRNPAMSPHTQGHPGTRHTVITVEREREKRKQKGGIEGRQTTKKALPGRKDNLLEKAKAALRPSQHGSK